MSKSQYIAGEKAMMVKAVGHVESDEENGGVKFLYDREFKPGDIVRHFKGMLYEVIGICQHTEDKIDMMCYRALYGPKRMYVRPLDMFMSKTDKKKYPNASQEYRMIKVTIDDMD